MTISIRHDDVRATCTYLARARLPNVGVDQATPEHENVCTFI